MKQEKFTDFTSSNVKGLIYFPKSKNLQVTFFSGTYTYHGVPANDWEALKSAPSKGKFLNGTIEPKYKFTRGVS